MKAVSLELPISTARLTVRRYRPDDIDAVFDLQSRDDVTRYIPWPRRTREECVEWLEAKIAVKALVADGDVVSLAVTRRDDDLYVGEVLLFLVSDKHRQGEIGYVIHPDHHGKGYATEAAAALIEAAFTTFDFHRIQARLDARNTASARLAERLGMRREAHLVENEFNNGEWEDEVIYGVLAREWGNGASHHPRPQST